MKKALTLTYRTSLWLVNSIIGAKHLKIRKSAIFGSVYTCKIRTQPKGYCVGYFVLINPRSVKYFILAEPKQIFFYYAYYIEHVHNFIKL